MSTDEYDHEHVGQFIRTGTSVILECTGCGDIELITALPPATGSSVAFPEPR